MINCRNAVKIQFKKKKGTGFLKSDVETTSNFIEKVGRCSIAIQPAGVAPQTSQDVFRKSGTAPSSTEKLNSGGKPVFESRTTVV